MLLSSSEEEFPLNLWEQKDFKLNLNVMKDDVKIIGFPKNLIWKAHGTSKVPNGIFIDYKQPVYNQLNFEEDDTKFRIIIFALLDSTSKNLDKSAIPINDLYTLIDSGIFELNINKYKEESNILTIGLEDTINVNTDLKASAFKNVNIPEIFKGVYMNLTFAYTVSGLIYIKFDSTTIRKYIFHNDII